MSVVEMSDANAVKGAKALGLGDTPLKCCCLKTKIDGSKEDCLKHIEKMFSSDYIISTGWFPGGKSSEHFGKVTTKGPQGKDVEAIVQLLFGLGTDLMAMHKSEYDDNVVVLSMLATDSAIDLFPAEFEHPFGTARSVTSKEWIEKKDDIMSKLASAAFPYDEKLKDLFTNFTFTRAYVVESTDDGKCELYDVINATTHSEAMAGVLNKKREDMKDENDLHNMDTIFFICGGEHKAINEATAKGTPA